MEFDVVTPKPPDIDPVRDAQSRKIDNEIGYRSVQEMIREDGRDPVMVEQELMDWKGKAAMPTASGDGVGAQTPSVPGQENNKP